MVVESNLLYGESTEGCIIANGGLTFPALAKKSEAYLPVTTKR